MEVVLLGHPAGWEVICVRGSNFSEKICRRRLKGIQSGIDLMWGTCGRRHTLMGTRMRNAIIFRTRGSGQGGF